MQKRLFIRYFFIAVLLLFVLSGCKKETKSTTGQADACISVTDSPDANPYEYLDFLSTEEQKRLVISDDPDYEGIAQVKLYDEQIDDTYDIRVSIPDYSDDKNEYPVVYLLGREATIANLNLLKECNSADAIYVLIGYEEGSSYDETIQRDYVDLEENFYYVITDKVMPLIENVYRGSLSESTLCASEEAAAYISEYGVLEDGFKFKNYILISPDFNFLEQKESIFEKEEEFAKKEKELSTNLYFLIGKDSEKTEAVNQTKGLVKLIAAQQFEHNQVNVIELAGYGSDTVWKPAIVAGIKQVFGAASKSVSIEESELLLDDGSNLSSKEEDSFKYSKIGIRASNSIMSDSCDAYDQEIDDNFLVNVYYPKDFKSSDNVQAVLLPYTSMTEEDICSIIEQLGENKKIIAIVVKGMEADSEERDMCQSPGAFAEFLIQNVIQKVEDDMHCSFEGITLAGSDLQGYFVFYTMFHEDTFVFHKIMNYIVINPDLEHKTDEKSVADFQSEYEKRNASENLLNLYVYYNEEASNGNKIACDYVVKQMKSEIFSSVNLSVKRAKTKGSKICEILLSILNKVEEA